jgi:hypothetical protein
MPMNERMVEIILSNSDLIEENELPPCFKDLCAHVYGYKAIIKAWEKEDYSNHISLINFPGKELRQYIENNFQLLKKRQSELIDKIRITAI